MVLVMLQSLICSGQNTLKHCENKHDTLCALGTSIVYMACCIDGTFMLRTLPFSWLSAGRQHQEKLIDPFYLHLRPFHFECEEADGGGRTAKSFVACRLACLLAGMTAQPDASQSWAWLSTRGDASLPVFLAITFGGFVGVTDVHVSLIYLVTKVILNIHSKCVTYRGRERRCFW
jgi:hypothetical protein